MDMVTPALWHLKIQSPWRMLETDFIYIIEKLSFEQSAYEAPSGCGSERVFLDIIFKS